MAGAHSRGHWLKMRVGARRIGGKNGREIKDYLDKVYHRCNSEAQGYRYRIGPAQAQQHRGITGQCFREGHGSQGKAFGKG